MLTKQFHRKPGKAFAIGAVFVLLSGCTIFGDSEDLQATVSGKPKISFEALRAKDPQAKIGAREHPKILKAYGGEFQSEKLESLLAPIAGALVTYSNDPDRAYDITVLNSPTVNAFALPGGYLYVTRGLLALANDQSEVAAVLAHEISHVSSNHGIERSRQTKAADIAGRVVENVVTSDLAGKVAKASTARRLSAFSQSQELQADSLGIKLIGTAGFDPFASARFLVSMKRFAAWRSALNAQDDDMSSSHPSTPKRVELARRHARALGPERRELRNQKRYLDGINGLMFGDSAHEGYVRANSFYHKRLGITFAVPTNFVLNNRSSAVLASGPNETALRFDAVKQKGAANPAEYLASGWVNGLQKPTVMAREINGMKAATGRALAGDWQFAVTVIAWKKRYFRFILAAPKSNPPIEAVAAGIARSFKQMTAVQKQNIQPQKIKIVRVGAADTIASMAAKMRGSSRKVQLFMALNGLASGERLLPGSRVKIISY